MSDDTPDLATLPAPEDHEVEHRDRLVVRFAGDSGDGMQLAGNRFTDASAAFGNDLATYPSFPAEIRAPAGTIPGVSAFQIHIADFDILTPGDRPDVLVAMNPAALKANLADVEPGGILVINEEAFVERNLDKAGWEANPLEDGSLDSYQVYLVPMETLTKEGVEGSGLSGRGVLRSKNFLALGLLAWMFGRPTEPTINWITEKFSARTDVMNANIGAFKTGYNYGITTEAFAQTYQVKAASLPPGEYTNVNGTLAMAWGLIAAGQSASLPLFYASYPITPASDLLHELARHRQFGVRTFQAEDEIAAVGAALGASFAGQLAITGTSGPGVALKAETIALATATELPMIVVDVQRAGPSTGMPTKPEQSDLFIALFGRHGEGTIPIVSIASPSDAFETAIEAARIALKYMTPVIIMSDAYIATSAEPWKLPDLDAIPDLTVHFASKTNKNGTYLPYLRDDATLSRPWAIPGTPGLEHRVGGLEKQHETGNVSYDPINHQMMTELRAQKIAGIANDIAPAAVDGDGDAKVLVVAWGSTFGAVRAGCLRVRQQGGKVDHVHVRHLNPLPNNLEELLGRYDKILIPELNTGQLRFLIRGKYLIDSEGLNKVQGTPLFAGEVEEKIWEMLK